MTLAGGEIDGYETASAKSEKVKLIVASFLCLAFMIIEMIGGYYAGSLAIMTDAAHLMSDLGGFVLSLVAISVGELPGDHSMSYGYARAEVIGALVSVMFIWALTGVLLFFALIRLFHPQPVDGLLMLVLGIIGLSINIVLGFVLGHNHHHAHSHDDHSHSHHHHDDHDEENGERTELLHNGDHHHSHSHPSHNHRHGSSVNMQAAYLHVLGDILQNVGVILAALVIWWKPSWTLADPLCTLLFTIIVMITTWPLVKDTVNVLMEGIPKGVHLQDIINSLGKVQGVLDVQDLHVWSLTLGGAPALSVHVNTRESEQHYVLKRVQKLLKNRFGVLHATIQVNCVQEDCCDDANNESEMIRCVSAARRS
mmetsp:Transcript_11640/g.21069  ORF Transcript_11640/g.21069 Transcript_11640/m.21069 type:complete len:367 (+) Transcript_11640:124-1224(+)